MRKRSRSFTLQNLSAIKYYYYSPFHPLSHSFQNASDIKITVYRQCVLSYQEDHCIQTLQSQISRRSLLRYRGDHCMQTLQSQILRRSLYTDSAPSVSWASTRFARTFPSCTPSWSKLFTFHKKPWNITLFSKCASSAPSVFGRPQSSCSGCHPSCRRQRPRSVQQRLRRASAGLCFPESPHPCRSGCCGIRQTEAE